MGLGSIGKIVSTATGGLDAGLFEGAGSAIDENLLGGAAKEGAKKVQAATKKSIKNQMDRYMDSVGMLEPYIAAGAKVMEDLVANAGPDSTIVQNMRNFGTDSFTAEAERLGLTPGDITGGLSDFNKRFDASEELSSLGRMKDIVDISATGSAKGAGLNTAVGDITAAGAKLSAANINSATLNKMTTAQNVLGVGLGTGLELYRSGAFTSGPEDNKLSLASNT